MVKIFRLLLVLLFLMRADGVLAKSKTDTAEVNRLNRSAAENRRKDLGLSQRLAEKALTKSKQLQYTRGKFEAHFNLGQVYFYQFDFNRSLEQLLEACRIAEKAHYLRELSECYYTIGKIHRHQKNYSKALGFSHKGLHIAIAEKDSSRISMLLNGIGNIHGEMKQFDSCMFYYRKRLLLEQKTGRPESLASILTNIGNVHAQQGQHDSALHYYQVSLGIIERSSIWEQDRTFRKFGGSLLYLMADSYYEKNDLDKAEDYALRALDIVTKDSAKREMMEVYAFLSELYENKKQFDRAHHYLMRYTKIKDLVFNEENSRQFAEMETRYQTEKKEQELKIKTANLDREQQRSRFIIVVSVAAIAFMLLLGWFLYYRYKIRQRHQFEKELQHQQKLRYRAVMDAQEQEKKRIAGELHDGLGQILATARIHLSGVEENNSEQENQKFLQTGLNLLDSAAAEVRTISHQMMPAALVKIGLVQAVSDLFDKINQSKKINFTLDNRLPENFDLGQEITINLFRIVQEITSNCIKYSKAQKAALALSLSNQDLVVEYTDNGIGLAQQQINESKGIGWKNIFSRVELLDGKIDVRTAPGNGLRIKIQLPLRP